MNRIDLIVLSPANHFRALSGKPSSKLDGYPIHNNLPRLRLAATKTQERRKDADDSELSHNDRRDYVYQSKTYLRISLYRIRIKY
jgi:hypothetical protein